MRIKFIIILLSLFFAIPISGSGQVRSLLKKKTNEKADKKVEEGVLNLSNKLFKKSKEDMNKAVVEADSISDESNINNNAGVNQMANNPLLDLMTSGGSKIKHEDTYTFDNSIKMFLEGEETEGQGEMYFTSYYNSRTNDVAVTFESKGQDSNSHDMVKIITILDYTNKCGIMLTSQSGQKIAIVTDIEEEDDLEVNYEDEDESISMDDYNYNKTGNTKKILGYKCYEYEYTTNAEKGVFWVTDELKFKMDRKAIEKSGMPVLVGEDQLEGMVTMEMFFYDEEGNSSHMVVTEVNMDSKETISLAGYNVMSIGGEVDN